MFDIGFWELCLIAIVALLILGPERLPIAARTAGLWIGKARKMIGSVKNEIDRELQLDEVRKRIQEEENNLREATGIDDLESLTNNTIHDVQNFQEDVLNSDNSHGGLSKEESSEKESSKEDNKESENSTEEQIISEDQEKNDKVTKPENPEIIETPEKEEHSEITKS